MEKVYFIGAGPGDPELITVKGQRLIKEADVIIYAGSLVPREVINCHKEGAEIYNSATMTLEEVMDVTINAVKNNKMVARVHTGDPMTYSTYVYILEYLDEKYQVETIPGISSFVDIASRVNIPLVIGDENLKVIGLYRKCDRDFIIKHIEENDNLVVMKASLKFEELKEALKITGNENNIVLVCDSGKPNQRVYFDIMDLKKDEIPYFSTLILKKGGIEKWKKFIS